MAILRISPNDYNGDWIDDTSLILKTLKNSDGTDNKVTLSDSDGNELGVKFKPKARRMRVIGETGEYVEQNVINMVLVAESEAFISSSLHVRSTIILNEKGQVGRISPLQIYSKNNAYLDAYDVVMYPVESPNDDDYFNSRNKLNLIDYKSSVPLNKQMEESLYQKSPAWFDENVNESEIVKVDGKIVYVSNKDYEEIPVLYTRDYVLGHCSGHTTYISPNIRAKYIGNQSGSSKTIDGGTVATKLSYLRLDKMVWEKVGQIVAGEKRHTTGRYNNLGASENESITQRLFGTLSVPLLTAPLVGQGVPEGTIAYNAIAPHRYFFHLMRQEARNLYDETNDTSRMSAALRGYIADGKISMARPAEPGFSAEIVKEYALCDGKAITYDNYKALSTKNANIYQTNKRGNAVRDTDGKPLAATLTGALEAVKISNDGVLKTPCLLDMGSNAMRYLRGLNWVSSIGVDSAISPERDYREDMFTDNNYQIQVVEGTDVGAVKKNLKDVGSYRCMYDFKIRNEKHFHYCFSNQPGNPVWPGSDQMYAYTTQTPKTFRFFGKSYTYYVTTTGIRSLDTQLWTSLLTPNAEYFWNDLFTYSFTNERRTQSAYKQTQAFLYGCTPIRTAGLHAWRVQSDGVPRDDFEDRVTEGEFFIQNSTLTPIEADKTKRKEQLYMLNMAEGRAPISYTGKGGGSAFQERYSAKCKRGSKFHHTHDGWRVSAARGGYTIAKTTDDEAEKYNYVSRCVTSLPVGEAGELGELESSSTSKTVTIGDQQVTVDTSLSAPPSMNFMPLLKV